MASTMSTADGTGAGIERCSACGRSTVQVKRLLPGRVAGVQLVICDRCVLECEQTIADAPTRIPGAARSCAFCTKPEEQVAVIVGVGSKKICDECVDAYRAELD
jgi:ATP-dependent protease Clp ATPase subunit